MSSIPRVSHEQHTWRGDSRRKGKRQSGAIHMPAPISRATHIPHAARWPHRHAYLNFDVIDEHHHTASPGHWPRLPAASLQHHAFPCTPLSRRRHIIRDTFTCFVRPAFHQRAAPPVVPPPCFTPSASPLYAPAKFSVVPPAFVVSFTRSMYPPCTRPCPFCSHIMYHFQRSLSPCRFSHNSPNNVFVQR